MFSEFHLKDIGGWNWTETLSCYTLHQVEDAWLGWITQAYQQPVKWMLRAGTHKFLITEGEPTESSWIKRSWINVLTQLGAVRQGNMVIPEDSVMTFSKLIPQCHLSSPFTFGTQALTGRQSCLHITTPNMLSSHYVSLCSVASTREKDGWIQPSFSSTVTL